MKTVSLICHIGLLLALTSSCNTSAMPRPKLKIKHETNQPKVSPVKLVLNAIAYLDKFGYNTCNCRLECMGDGKNISCPTSMESMLETFQTFYSLPVTKKLDPETLKLMNTARCGIQDKLFSSNQGRKRWFRSKKTYKWKLANHDLPALGAAKTRQQIQQSFNDWAKHSTLTFHEASENDEADFNLVFVDRYHSEGYPFDGSGGVLAYTTDPFSGSVHFDATEEWTNKYNGTGYNLRRIATHQIGHALGLDHSNDTPSVMFPYYQLMQPKDLLSKIDRSLIQTLYGKPGLTTASSNTTVISTAESEKGQIRFLRTINTDVAATTNELVKSRKENGRYVNSFNPAFKFPSPAIVLRWKIGAPVNTRLPYTRQELDKTLPVIRHNKSEELYQTIPGLRFIWIGHASCFVQMNNFRFLVDPVFSERCGITSYIGPKRFRSPALTINDLPDDLDAILISHNHFDHLDYSSVKRLNKRYGKRLTWFCGRGTRQWFLNNYVKNVVELDWWETYHFSKKKVNIAFCPAQHWSRRSAFDLNKSLWGGFSVWDTTHKFYFAGDTGYTHNISIFRQIGKKYGPFDLSAIPIGAYEPRWMMEAQHVSPDEAVQIHIDVQSKKSIGIHWGTWALANEYFMEPPTKLAQAVKTNQLDPSSFIVVKHGEIFDLH